MQFLPSLHVDPCYALLSVPCDRATATIEWLTRNGCELDSDSYDSACFPGLHVITIFGMSDSVRTKVEARISEIYRDYDAEFAAVCDDRMARYGY